MYDNRTLIFKFSSKFKFLYCPWLNYKISNLRIYITDPFPDDIYGRFSCENNLQTFARSIFSRGIGSKLNNAVLQCEEGHLKSPDQRQRLRGRLQDHSPTSGHLDVSDQFKRPVMHLSQVSRKLREKLFLCRATNKIVARQSKLSCDKQNCHATNKTVKRQSKLSCNKQNCQATKQIVARQNKTVMRQTKLSRDKTKLSCDKENCRETKQNCHATNKIVVRLTKLSRDKQNCLATGTNVMQQS
jgi:hypothetical protein